MNIQETQSNVVIDLNAPDSSNEIEIEKGNHCIIVDHIHSNSKQDLGRKKIVINESACVQYINLVEGSNLSCNTVKRRVEVGDNAKLNSHFFYFDLSGLSFENDFFLHKRSVVSHFSVFLLSDAQDASLNEKFIFSDIRGRGRFVSQGVLLNKAKLNYRGNIIIQPKAQQTVSRLEAHSHLFGDDAQSSMIPMLEIGANNVRAGHAATVSSIDKEKEFYLSSRGLTKQQIVRLFIQGILSSSMERIEYKPLFGKIDNIVEKKLAII